MASNNFVNESQLVNENGNKDGHQEKNLERLIDEKLNLQERSPGLSTVGSQAQHGLSPATPLGKSVIFATGANKSNTKTTSRSNLVHKSNGEHSDAWHTPIRHFFHRAFLYFCPSFSFAIENPEASSRNKFLEQSLRVANIWIQTLHFASIIEEHYELKKITVANNIQNIVVKYDELKEDQLATTTRDIGDENRCIYIKEYYKKRLTTLEKSTDPNKQHEFKVIIVFQAVLIIHELGHLMLGWKGLTFSPEAYGFEAGFFLERALFFHRVHYVRKRKNEGKNDDDDEFVGISIEGKSYDDVLVDSEYIDELYEFGVHQVAMRNFKRLPMVANYDLNLSTGSYRVGRECSTQLKEQKEMKNKGQNKGFNEIKTPKIPKDCVIKSVNDTYKIDDRFTDVN